MRPLAGSEAFQPRSRKPSVAEPHPVPDARSTSPVTYFLRRASQGNEASSSVDALPGHIVSPVQSLADTLDSLPQSTSTIVPQKDREEAGHSPRRRSTLKARETTDPPGTLSTQSQNQTLPQEPLTPLLIPSNTSSLPSSPKSTSIKSLRPSEASSVAEDAGSQAIFSSGDEEPGPEPPLQLEEAAPQLIMPSIRMPSRRPFTERGKQIGNFKVLIAGSKGLESVPWCISTLLTILGVGKTSLIKSIVQICEDIVHVDPLPTGKPSMVRSYSKGKHRSAGPEQPQIAEINASTRPYPSWWSEIEDSKVLRRRKSLGDTILDRNLCFVDTASHENPNIISEYMAMQIQKAIKAPTTAKHDFAALLSGSGGSQVDLIFYMLSGGEDPPHEINRHTNKCRYARCRYLTHTDSFEAGKCHSVTIKGRPAFS